MTSAAESSVQRPLASRRAGAGWAGDHFEMVRLLDEDPELGCFLAPGAAALASAAALAPLVAANVGPTPLRIGDLSAQADLGLLMLDGLIARHLSFGRIGSVEFLGPGDLVRTRRSGNTAEEVRVRWEVLAPARLAVLDRDFANRTRAWPELTAALVDRAARRCDFSALQAALHEAKHVEDRVLLALWHFAGRWGHVGPEGRIVTLPNITGETLARFVGARRQSVSTALGQLASSGAIRRRPDGSLVLPREPAELG